MNQPRVILIAGPNGAGKTTFAREYLPCEAACTAFLNADLIAAGLSPFAPEKAAIQAARLMLEAIDEHVARKESFVLETTLSGMGYARQIPEWRKQGYLVELHFLALPSAEIAAQRVAARVRQGGHDIPADVIRRRFASGRRLLEEVYQPIVDRWMLYENVDGQRTLVDWSDIVMTTPQQLRESQPGYAGLPADASPALRGAMAAMRRAFERACLIAEQTGTEVIVVRDGRGVALSPTEARELVNATPPAGPPCSPAAPASARSS